MGKLGDPKTCVDHDLRVLGVNSLRVADMSILPIEPKYVSMSSCPPKKPKLRQFLPKDSAADLRRLWQQPYPNHGVLCWCDGW
jgi:hypothetical protein